jgi:predicted nuclease with TOPRIM domain
MTVKPLSSVRDVPAVEASAPAALSDRLAELRAEWTTGQRRLEVLELERQQVRETLLRISGAIQVLEELCCKKPADKGLEVQGA